jgi:molybdopterin-guanine dinucleotide biosynthesis protein A
MHYPCTGIILAGGLNTRFSGRNKALIQINGHAILDSILTLFSEVFDEIILVTNDPLQYLDRDVLIVTDLYSHRSSLTGLHAGLVAAAHSHAFVTSCDAPFLKKGLVTHILDQIEPNIDVVIPQVTLGLEPLCAVYSKRCIKPIEQNLSNNRLKIQGFFPHVRVRKIPEEVLDRTDPGLASFFNVNTPEDLIRAKALVNGE